MCKHKTMYCNDCESVSISALSPCSVSMPGWMCIDFNVPFDSNKTVNLPMKLGSHRNQHVYIGEVVRRDEYAEKDYDCTKNAEGERMSKRRKRWLMGSRFSNVGCRILKPHMDRKMNVTQMIDLYLSLKRESNGLPIVTYLLIIIEDITEEPDMMGADTRTGLEPDDSSTVIGKSSILSPDDFISVALHKNKALNKKKTDKRQSSYETKSECPWSWVMAKDEHSIKDRMWYEIRDGTTHGINSEHTGKLSTETTCRSKTGGQLASALRAQNKYGSRAEQPHASLPSG
ncbi:hypothetical protein EJ03DRAFT_339704 [Teratosphaeria nubilosa]|uniref:Uncharacterized protein n=1 Tax=Teratosphaeria nubilosa TaxID=161662 RepID=A0A6G1KV45_9PEZI|nr:hypothetical protein EJ03DRAFT_339704 [Teratosphaeria nubilosa]